jgi:ABC-2 type transport system ATP-binding protein
VLDEPTAGVDPAGSRDIRNLIVDLKTRGVTVLLSSHLLGQVQEICDRVGILAKGTLVREGHLEELLAIEDRTELVLENAPDKLLKGIEKLAAKSKTKVIARRKSSTTLERLFLDATSGQESK